MFNFSSKLTVGLENQKNELNLSNKAGVSRNTTNIFPFASQIILRQFDKTLHNTKLTIRIVKGEIQNVIDFIGEMRPFIIFKYKDQTFKTKQSFNNSFKPEWNETFEFKVGSMQD